MKITDPNAAGIQPPLSPSSTTKTDVVSSGGSAKTSKTQTVNTPDDVQLSGFGTQLQAKIRETLSSDPPGRAEQVARLAAAYKNGTYKVDSEATSQGIINDSLKIK